ncbi:MAG: hypothetical protein K8R60_10205 [Burkholderiales bacterium]|nr:hypothetical protein [Burkholderiales bacterium]
MGHSRLAGFEERAARALECGTLAFGAPFQFGQRLVDGIGAAVEVAVARVRRYLREHAVDEAVERCALPSAETTRPASATARSIYCNATPTSEEDCRKVVLTA